MPAPYETLADAQKAGAVTMNIGLFVTSLVSFIIIAFTVFLLVKAFNRIRHQDAASELPTHAKI